VAADIRGRTWSGRLKADLPGDAEFVGGPAEFFVEGIGAHGHQDLAALCEFVEYVVDLVLGFAVDAEGEGGGEGEGVFCVAVDAGEDLAVEDEAGMDDGAFGAGFVGAVPGDVEETGIWEDRDIKIDRLFGAAVEHEEVGDLLHGQSLFEYEFKTFSNGGEGENDVFTVYSAV